MTSYVFQRGETISLGLDAVVGDPATVTSVSAALKPVAAGRSSIDPAGAVAANFVVSARAASVDAPAGWTLTLSNSVTAALTAGSYLADARLVVGGGVSITEPVAVKLVDAVTVS